MGFLVGSSNNMDPNVAADMARAIETKTRATQDGNQTTVSEAVQLVRDNKDTIGLNEQNDPLNNAVKVQDYLDTLNLTPEQKNDVLLELSLPRTDVPYFPSEPSESPYNPPIGPNHDDPGIGRWGE